MKPARKERLQHENDRQDKYIEREKHIIAVITSNTEVNAGLRATLEMISANTNQSFARIHERLDDHGDKLTEHGANITKTNTTLEEVVRKQHVISEDVKRGFEEIRNNLKGGQNDGK